MRLLLVAASLALSGCAAVPEKPQFTTRRCIITYDHQVGEHAVAVYLLCDQERSTEPEGGS